MTTDSTKKNSKKQKLPYLIYLYIPKKDFERDERNHF